MASADIQYSGGSFNSINQWIGDATTSATETGTIIGNDWDDDDATAVTWDKAVIIVANSDAKQIGKPWVSGGTEYRHRVASGHAFTVTADVDITDINIQSDSSTGSDELFRAAGTYSGTITNCMLGFTGTTSEQDIWYSNDSATKTISFVQCFIYDVDRAIVHIQTSGETGTVTINWNACGALGVGMWFRTTSNDTNNTFDCNAQSCLLNATDAAAFVATTSNPTLNVDAPRCITNIANEAALGSFDDTIDTTGTLFAATWRTSTGGGDEVLLVNITSTTYDPNLVDDETNNDAQSRHATRTDATLEIPAFDILGQERDITTPLFDCGPHALTLAAGGGGPSIPVLAYNHYQHNLG